MASLESPREYREWQWDRKPDQLKVKESKSESERLKIIYDEKSLSVSLVLRLAFQSLGVVYGDLGTSPLYVFQSTFTDGIKNKEDVIGALSFIIYSLTFIPLMKYVFIVCRANDRGQGGTFALYSLLCRHASIGDIHVHDQTDEKLTTYSRSSYDGRSFAARTKKWLEKNSTRKHLVLVLVLVGSCMVIGDGILTPAISVLAAVGGLKTEFAKIPEEAVVVIASVIIVALFSIQYLGTDKVGWIFAPILFVWFLLLSGIGIFNIVRYDKSVVKAFSPIYMYRYLKRGGTQNFTSLGGIMLSITGTEALFADLSNFSVSAIQIAFTTIVFPSLLLSYIGQAAYLMEYPEQISNLFYSSIPDIIYWPMLVLATAAASVASQATITATFSLIKQAVALGCFPRVKVVHTSKKFLHQIYIPDINWILMILCVAVTAGFKNQIQIGNASGTAVVIVMLVTTFLMILIMLLVWNWHWLIVLIFTIVSLAIEITYFSAVLFKLNQGGWVPLAIAAGLFVIMWVWRYGTLKRYEFERHSEISMGWILGLGPSLGLTRVPGIGLLYTELSSGIPHIFTHLITNLPAIHSVVIFVCVRYVPVYTVPEGERFLVTRVGPNDFHMFRCVARYGYKDLHRKDDEFEEKLFESLFRLVRLESLMQSCGSDIEQYSDILEDVSVGEGVPTVASLESSIVPVDTPTYSQGKTDVVDDEAEFLARCREAGVVHILGNSVVTARRNSNIFNKIAINYLYSFLRKVCRDNSAMFYIPHESLLNVGQVVHV
ncbi:PREDICTED: potassium transporter 11-like [Tarenaya hassleriana]|uniref:potassium transporter 11-like n=1 Tax=Tarenaya hassleriana TaxID=28532 RepID=UPI00053C07ED|nr:PREDICTED: potassium transporter 11-like [Tarenaya hassleriana]